MSLKSIWFARNVSGLTGNVGVFYKIFVPVSSFLISIAGLVVLTSLAGRAHAPMHVISFALFGSALIILYALYIVYHLVRETKYENTIKKFHTMATYVLISATYTPIYLIAFPSGWGWAMFGATWAVTVFGIVLYFFQHISSKVHAMVYIIIDWLIVISFFPLYESLPFFAIKVLTLGSALYTMSVIMDRLNHPYLAQVNMLLGSVVHIWFMYMYILG